MYKKDMYKYLDLCQLVATIIAIPASAVTIFTYFQVDPLWYYDNFRYLPLVTLASTTLIFMLISLKLYKVSNSRLKYFSRNFHKLTHTMRDEFYLLRQRYMDKTLNGEFLIVSFKECTQKVVDWLADTLTKSTGNTISVSIKFLGTGEETTGPVNENITVTTLCRSKNTKDLRDKSLKSALVVENSDFYDLLIRGDDVFYASDLIAYAKSKEDCGQKYLNSTPDWKDYYQSTIVAPIRLSHSKKSNKSHLVMGFLCIDSMSTSAFNGDIKEYSHLVRAYADCLYKYFDRFVYYQQKISKK